MKLFFLSFTPEIYILHLLLKITPGRIISAEICALVPWAETYLRSFEVYVLKIVSYTFLLTFFIVLELYI